MPIPVKHEDIEELKEWGLGLHLIVEACALCHAPSRTWYTPANLPVCASYAAVREVADLPTRKSMMVSAAVELDD